MTVLLGFLFACSGGDDASEGPAPSTPTSPPPDPGVPLDERVRDVLDVWEAIARAVRESPDHREARAAEAIATKDPEAIFAFVRDAIASLPLTDDDIPQLFRSDNSAWFGGRGAIRGGLGTPRDRAEALATMLTEAGFEAEVHWAYAEDEPPAVGTLYSPRATPPFAPDSGDLTAWAEPWGGDIAGSPSIIDADGREVTDLATALGSFVTETPTVAVRGVDLTPVVEVEIDGVERILNPIDPLATFDDPRTEGHAATFGLRTPELSVRVWARRVGSGDEVDLVSRTWQMHELVGRRVVYRARPVLDFPVALATPIGDVPVFLPSLSVEEPGEDLAEQSTVGPTVSWLGDVFGEDPITGVPTINGRSLASSDDDEEQRARVAQLEVVADASRYPQVALTVQPTDSSGALVPGLGGRSFRVTDDGVPVGAVLRSNVFAPRVIVLIDGSTSVPEEWRDDGVLPFVKQLASQVLALPDAEMVAQAVGEIPFSFAEFTTDPATVVDQAADQGELASNVWTSLDRAVARDPDLVIAISDFSTTDALTPAIEARLRDGDAQIVGIGVGPVDQDTLDAVVDVMGGASVEPDNAADALGVALSQLDPLAQTYQLVYHAPKGVGKRKVEVTAGTTGTTTYEVPTEPRLGRGFAGLYVTVELQGRGEVTRTVAGLAPNVDAAIADAAVLEQVEAALHATVSLVVEGGGPGLSQVVDDELRSRLALRDWVDHLDDRAAFDAALLASGTSSSPWEPISLVQDLASDEKAGWTVPLGPRLVLHTLRPGYAEGDGLRRVDLLPLTRFFTVHDDPAIGWRRTFERTLQLAIIEGATQQWSTVAALRDVSLQAIDAAALPEPFATDERWLRLAEDLDEDWTLLVPADGEPIAAWAVHEPTGTALGLLEDGIGGGESIEDRLERDARLFDRIRELHGMSGLGGGVWLELEIAKAKVVAYATVAIANLEGWDGAPEGPTPEEIVEGFLCSRAEGAVTDTLPAGIGEALAEYARWAEALELPPPSVCP